MTETTRTVPLLRMALAALALVMALCYAGIVGVLLYSGVLFIEMGDAGLYYSSLLNTGAKRGVGVVILCMPAVVAYVLASFWARHKGERALALWRVGIVGLYFFVCLAASSWYRGPWAFGVACIGAVVLFGIVLNGMLRFVWRTHKAPFSTVIMGTAVAAAVGGVVGWLLTALGYAAPLRFVPCATLCWLAGIGCITAALLLWNASRTLCAACIVYLVAACMLLAYLRADSPPAPMPYARASLPQPSRGAAESRAAQMPVVTTDFNPEYTVVMPGIPGWSLVDPPAPGSTTTICAYSTVIEQAWVASTNYRSVLATLDTFEGVADVATNMVVPRLKMRELFKATQLMGMYAVLKARQGNAREGVAVLATHNSVIRKALPYSCSLLNKMTWIAVAGINLTVAYDIASDTNTPTEVLRAMKDQFPSLSCEAVRLKECMMGEWVVADEFARAVCANPRAILEYRLKQVPPAAWLVRVFVPFVFNRNTTLRGVRQFIESALVGISKNPMEVTADIDHMLLSRTTVSIKNGMGLCIAMCCKSDFHGAIHKAEAAKVRSDLLAIRIRQRLGEPIEIKDYFSGAPYLIDQKTGAPYSAGPDKEQGTADDIRMQVLAPNNE